MENPDCILLEPILENCILLDPILCGDCRLGGDGRLKILGGDGLTAILGGDGWQQSSKKGQRHYRRRWFEHTKKQLMVSMLRD